MNYSPGSVPVTGISLDRPALTFNSLSDRTTKLLATIEPDNASNKKISWSTDQAQVVTVDDNGLVTAVGEGKAVITAATEDGNYKAASSVTVDWTAPEITIHRVVTSEYNTGIFQPKFELSDSLTGIDNKKTEVMLDGKVLNTVSDIPMYKLDLGTHTFTVTAFDLAGNTATRSIEFQVNTSYETLEELVHRFADVGWIDNQGIANSLLKKLQKQNLSSFIQEVHAQKRKHIAAEAAGYILRDAKALRNQ